MTRETSISMDGLKVDLQALVPPVLWGGYGARMAHDLANDLTTLSALKSTVERSGQEGSSDWVGKTVWILDKVTQALASRVRGFNELRERFEGAGNSLTGKDFLQQVRPILESLGWEWKGEEMVAPSLMCHVEILGVCLAALHHRMTEPREASLSLLPTVVTGGRPMVALTLGYLRKGDDGGEAEDHVLTAANQLVRTMGGLLEVQASEAGRAVRILLPRTS